MEISQFSARGRLLILRGLFFSFFDHHQSIIISPLLFLLLILLSIGCYRKQRVTNLYLSKALYSHRLIRLDSLSFFSTDSLFISRTAQIAEWNNRVLISDFYQKKLHVFDSQLRYLLSLGQKGSGPGEFQNFPGIMTERHGIWLIDEANWRANKYDAELRYILQRKLPKGYYFGRSPISLENKYIFDGHRAHVMYAQEDFEEYRPLTSLDTSFSPIGEFWEWDEVYFSNDLATQTYAQSNPHVLLARGRNGSFYALQKATHIIAHFDNALKLVKSFGLRPKFYKSPPSLPYEQTAFSPEMISEYAGNTTTMLTLACDTSTNVVYLNYVNLNKDVFWQRTMLAGVHYLQVFDASGDCIFDGEIPGKLAFVRQGMIYVQTEERPEFIKFVGFKLERQ